MNEEFTPKSAADEDWEIPVPSKNLPPNQRLLEPIEDWSMTGKLAAPKQNTANGWQMPEPTFRATSGSLPQNFVKNSSHAHEPDTQPLSFDDHGVNHPAVEETFEKAETLLPPLTTDSAEIFEPALSVSPIEEQPHITDAFAPAPEIVIEKPPEKKPRSKEMKIFLAVLGLSAMLVFAVLFLAVVYWLFFYGKTAAP